MPTPAARTSVRNTIGDCCHFWQRVFCCWALKQLGTRVIKAGMYKVEYQIQNVWRRKKKRILKSIYIIGHSNRWYLITATQFHTILTRILPYLYSMGMKSNNSLIGRKGNQRPGGEEIKSHSTLYTTGHERYCLERTLIHLTNKMNKYASRLYVVMRGKTKLPANRCHKKLWTSILLIKWFRGQVYYHITCFRTFKWAKDNISW